MVDAWNALSHARRVKDMNRIVPAVLINFSSKMESVKKNVWKLNIFLNNQSNASIAHLDAKSVLQVLNVLSANKNSI